MSLAKKVFKNNLTGEEVKVIDSFENIVILENKQKIDVNILMDTNKYTEQIDPGSFFNSQGSYNSLADKIKNIPVNNMIDEEGTVSINVDGGGLQPLSNESAVIMTTEEDERAELAKKYGAVVDDTNAVSKQNEAFSKILEDEDLPQAPLQPKTTMEVDNIQRVEVSREEVQKPINVQKPVDPIITMFKGVKRNVKFDINVEISDKIPRLDFIEMMEDSYEISLIDFLAEEFTDKILQNPNIIKDIITEKIKLLVYGAPKPIVVSENVKTEEKIVDKTTTSNDKMNNLKKLNASQRAKVISELKTVDMVKKALIGEKAKSVKEAGSKRIEELGKIIKM